MRKRGGVQSVCLRLRCSALMRSMAEVKHQSTVPPHLSWKSPLGLWVGRGQQRHIVPPPPPAQRGAPALLPVRQALGQRLPLALGQQQDGQHGQQSQTRVDHVVQEVAIVIR